MNSKDVVHIGVAEDVIEQTFGKGTISITREKGGRWYATYTEAGKVSLHGTNRTFASVVLDIQRQLEARNE